MTIWCRIYPRIQPRPSRSVVTNRSLQRCISSASLFRLPVVDTGFPRFVTYLLGALWLRGGSFAILTDVRSNVWDKVNYQLRLRSVARSRCLAPTPEYSQGYVSLTGVVQSANSNKRRVRHRELH